MFDNLKKKLKKFISRSSEELEVEEISVEELETIVEEVEPEPEVEEEPKPEPEAEEKPDVEKEPEPEIEEEPEPEPEEEQIIEEPEVPVPEIDQPVPEDKSITEPVPEREPKPSPEVEEVPIEEREVVEAKPKKKSFLSRFKRKKPEPEPKVEVEEVEPKVEPEEVEPEPEIKEVPIKPVPIPEEKQIPEKPAPKKKFSLFSKVTHKKISDKDVDDLMWELELALLENDVAKEVSEAIVAETKNRLLGSEAKRKSIEQVVSDSLKASIETILDQEQPDLFKLIDAKSEKPFTILFFGFNGTGKTMTIGKFAKMFKDKGYSVVLAAGDTFRAAAIEQLEEHAKNVDVPIIKTQRGADSAAVIFDAIKHAQAKGIDVVLGDTAGRGTTNQNLMDELKKVNRVNKPDFKIFVGDSLTGNDAADQAQGFNDAVGVDGSVLTKIDVDAKGGSCLSVTYITQKPILFLGTGQGYDDMIPFTADWFVSKVF